MRQGKGAVADPKTRNNSIKSIRHRRWSGKQRLPQVFEDHSAPESVQRLFVNWVRRADAVGNGVIMVNLRKEIYGHTTVAKAIKWLIAHRLLVRVERGGGRGCGSRYFVRWSFAHPTLSARQKEVNHPKTSDTVHSQSFRRNTEKNSLNRTTRPPINTAGQARAHPRALRWAAARIRETVRELPVDRGRKRELIDAAAAAIDRALRQGRVRPGSELGELVRGLRREIVSLRTGRSGRRASYSWAFGVVATITEEIARARAEEAETAKLLAEEREARRQAAAHPVGELLAEAGVERISDLIKKMVACGPGGSGCPSGNGAGRGIAADIDEYRRITRNDTGGRNAEEMHYLCAP